MAPRREDVTAAGAPTRARVASTPPSLPAARRSRSTRDPTRRLRTRMSLHSDVTTFPPSSKESLDAPLIIRGDMREGGLQPSNTLLCRFLALLQSRAPEIPRRRCNRKPHCIVSCRPMHRVANIAREPFAGVCTAPFFLTFTLPRHANAGEIR